MLLSVNVCCAPAVCKRLPCSRLGRHLRRAAELLHRVLLEVAQEGVGACRMRTVLRDRNSVFFITTGLALLHAVSCYSACVQQQLQPTALPRAALQMLSPSSPRPQPALLHHHARSRRVKREIEFGLYYWSSVSQALALLRRGKDSARRGLGALLGGEHVAGRRSEGAVLCKRGILPIVNARRCKSTRHATLLASPESPSSAPALRLQC
jgi:hypothetical protein